MLLILNGEPCRNRTYNLLIKSALRIDFRNSQARQYLHRQLHGYRMGNESLIRPSCPQSAAISTQLPTPYPQAENRNHLIWDSSSIRRPLSGPCSSARVNVSQTGPIGTP
jgi:hypothetical protein